MCWPPWPRVSPLPRVPLFPEQPWRSLTILLIYGYQGMVAGFATNAVPNLHAGLGTPVAQIGTFVAMVGLPWTFQPLWGPVVDRYGGFRMGRRRPWIIAGFAGALLALALIPLAGEGAGALPVLGLVLLGHSVFASLIDTATDGLIIDNVPTHRLGQATALTRVGFACGTAFGAANFAWLIPELGLPAASFVLLAIGAAIAAVPLAVRERAEDALLSLRQRMSARDPDARHGWGALFQGLWAALRQRQTLALLAFCIVQEFAVGAFGVTLSVGLVQVGGWQPAQISHLQGVMALAGGTVGALAVGWWSDRIGPHRALLTLLAACILSHLLAAWLLLDGDLAGRGAAVALVLSGVVPALFFVALAPAVMSSSRGTAAATRFALFMAALNLGGVLGAGTAGEIGAALAPWQVALGVALIFTGCFIAARRPGRLFRTEAMTHHG